MEFMPDFKKSPLIPAITQDAESREVLMLAWMNEEAWRLTVSTGFAHYFSRSRGKIWKKGESSGHLQRVKDIRLDCDEDTVLILVEQKGAACHEGYRSCFYRSVKNANAEINQPRLKNPEEIYSKND